jgi:peptide/nickel transport system ATP-binding protein
MKLLEVAELTVAYTTRHGATIALDSASLVVGAGERVGVIGESGSGKTTLAMTLGRLLPPNARIASGSIHVNARDVEGLAGEALRRFRRDEIGYVFQDPVATLDPTKRIEAQFRTLGSDLPNLDLAAALRAVELTDTARVLRSYPHELSGGMAQRVGIALALLRSPALILADEPTASLDAIVRKRILDLLVERTAMAGATLLLFTHDLVAVNSACNRVVVMYGGRVVEDGPRDLVFSDPVHPYTRALLRAAPGTETRRQRLEPIPGTPPVLRQSSGACAFAPRCAFAVAHCTTDRPIERPVGGRLVVCHEADLIRAQEMSQVG